QRTPALRIGWRRVRGREKSGNAEVPAGGGGAYEPARRETAGERRSRCSPKAAYPPARDRRPEREPRRAVRPPLRTLDRAGAERLRHRPHAVHLQRERRARKRRRIPATEGNRFPPPPTERIGHSDRARPLGPFALARRAATGDPDRL